MRDKKAEMQREVYESEKMENLRGGHTIGGIVSDDESDHQIDDEDLF